MEWPGLAHHIIPLLYKRSIKVSKFLHWLKCIAFWKVYKEEYFSEAEDCLINRITE